MIECADCIRWQEKHHSEIGGCLLMPMKRRIGSAESLLTPVQGGNDICGQEVNGCPKTNRKFYT